MKQYLNKITLTNTEIAIQAIPPESIHLILTDPPYGTTALNMDKNIKTNSLQDALKKHYLTILKQFHHILSPNGWLFIFAPIELASLIISETPFHFKFEYIWIKPNAASFRCNHRPLKKHEIIYAFTKSKNNPKQTYHKLNLRTEGKAYIRYHNNKQTEFTTSYNFDPNLITNNTGYREPTSILSYPNKSTMKYDERTTHPTQKPIELAKYIIHGFSNPNDIILDPYAGSGSFCIAAQLLERQFIGFEINKEYHALAINRLKKYNYKKYEQPELF